MLHFRSFIRQVWLKTLILSIASAGLMGLGQASDSERVEFDLDIAYDDFVIVKTAWEKYQLLSAALDETLISQTDTPAGLPRIQSYGVTPQEYLQRLETFGLQTKEYLKTWKNSETGLPAEEYVRLKSDSIIKMARRGIAIHGDLEFQNLKTYFDYFTGVLANREDRFEIVRSWVIRADRVERRAEMNQMRQVLRYAQETCEDLDDGELVTRPLLDAENILKRRHMMLYPEFEGVFPITAVKCVSGRQCEKELEFFKRNDRLVVAYTYDTRAVDRYHRLVTITDSRAVTASFSFPQIEDREADGSVWEGSSELGTGGVANIRMELDLSAHRFRKIEVEVRHHVFELTVEDQSENTTLRI